MNPSHTISHELAQDRIADLRRQARRESLARTALIHRAESEPRPRPSRVPVHLRLVHRRRVTTAIG